MFSRARRACRLGLADHQRRQVSYHRTFLELHLEDKLYIVWSKLSNCCRHNVGSTAALSAAVSPRKCQFKNFTLNWQTRVLTRSRFDAQLKNRFLRQFFATASSLSMICNCLRTKPKQPLSEQSSAQQSAVQHGGGLVTWLCTVT